MNTPVDFFDAFQQRIDDLYTTKFRIDEDSYAIGITIMLNAAMRFQRLIREKQQEVHCGTKI